MEDAISRGLPFAIDDHKKHRLPYAPVEDSIFGALDTVWEPLEAPFLPPQDTLDLAKLTLASDNDLPDLPCLKALRELPPKSADLISDHTSESHAESNTLDWSICELHDPSDPAKPKLLTWEVFLDKSIAASDQVAFLSEAGPAAFDAALTSQHPLDRVDALPQFFALRALRNLALGRSSGLFQWDSCKARFVRTLDGISVSGTSRSCSHNFCEHMIDMGSSIMRLRTFAEGVPLHKDSSSAYSALRVCVSRILGAIDEVISRESGSVRSALQLQQLVERPRGLLRQLESIVQQVQGGQGDNAVISAISQAIDGQLMADPRFCPVFEALLAQVSVPWCEQLASSLGFQNATTDLVTPNAQSKSRLLSGDDIPSFVDATDATLIREAVEAVELLRCQSRYHPLLTDVVHDEVSPFDCFINASVSKASVREVAHQYECRIFDVEKHDRSLPAACDAELGHVQQPDAVPWAPDMDQEEHLQDFYTRDLNSAIGLTTNRDPVHQQTLLACRADENCLVNSSTPHFRAELESPLDRVRCLIQVQHRRVSNVLLRQIFRDYRFSDHLDLHWQFHLFGNGEFLTRLSTALFSMDTQSAERSRGNLPTGATMGLQLGASHEERWPPASSELQLTLMGILQETYSTYNEKREKADARTSPLPGGLSFAIRQLPEQDIDRVLDPNSIYALDFLRLQYVAEQPLDAIFTAGILESYDSIFQFLLRLLRLAHITGKSPPRNTLNRKSASGSMFIGFTNQARSFVTTLATHAVDVGVSAPWRGFVDGVKKLEQDLDRDDLDESLNSGLLGIQGIRELHSNCLESIRSRLFLKRKQEKLRLCMEEVLSAVLRAAFALQMKDQSDAPSFEEQHRHFQQCVRELCSLLAQAANKPAKAASDADEAEMARLLLSKLTWNKFYDWNE